MKYILPTLDYEYNALEPFFDAKTMEVHYTKHHQAYTDKLNLVLEKYPDLTNLAIEDILKNINNYSLEDSDKASIINNGGGYINHSFFWKILGPEKQIDQVLEDKIISKYESIDQFKEKFTNIAVNHFGSGWAWLVEDAQGDLLMYSLPNQDNPLAKGHAPLIGLDLWEHAYYLNYQNRRAEYVQAWWNVLKLIH